MPQRALSRGFFEALVLPASLLLLPVQVQALESDGLHGANAVVLRGAFSDEGAASASTHASVKAQLTVPTVPELQEHWDFLVDCLPSALDLDTQECSQLLPIYCGVLSFAGVVLVCISHLIFRCVKAGRRAGKQAVAEKKADEKIGARCPNGHALTRYRTPGGSTACEKCGTEVQYMWGCRTCKWGVCASCYTDMLAENVEVATIQVKLPPSIAGEPGTSVEPIASFKAAVEGSASIPRPSQEANKAEDNMLKRPSSTSVVSQASYGAVQKSPRGSRREAEQKPGAVVREASNVSNASDFSEVSGVSDASDVEERRSVSPRGSAKPAGQYRASQRPRGRGGEEVSIEFDLTVDDVMREGEELEAWFEEKIHEQGQEQGLTQKQMEKMQENVELTDVLGGRYKSWDELEATVSPDHFPIHFKYTAKLPRQRTRNAAKRLGSNEFSKKMGVVISPSTGSGRNWRR